MCDVCVMLPSLLWLMERLTLAAQMDLEMIYNPAEARAVQGVFVFPSRSSPHCGLCCFSLKASPCCTEVVLLLQSLKIWWQTPFGNHTLYIPWGAPCFGGRFLFYFPVQSRPSAQLSSAALGWPISTAGGILLSSSQLPGSPSPSFKCSPSVADSCINFLLPAEFLRGTVHFTNPVCISTMTFTIKLFLQGGGGCVYLQAWLNSIFI